MLFPLRSTAQSVTVGRLNIPPLGDGSRFLPEVSEKRLVLRLRDRRVYYYDGETLITSYPVAIGRQGWETPTGEFQVIQKVEHPTWEHPFTGEIITPGPNNPLGVRWIGFWTDGQNFIGFHGTPNEELIGQAVSHGCVRMRNRDIVALFEKVEMGTPVIVE
ncbi:L,D-transpeptidase [Spirulina sp. CS-785/01]|uniref:L,D-transpeptidase n=1 Tax=Spirulina sp. CS-785/01 TaxID=3021716 RepID=UPI003FA74BAA